jgi:Cu+-exporting ATPase
MGHEHHTATEVLDPVCRMTISPEHAAGHVDHDGHTYYFCSEACLDRFKADPKRYLEPEAARPRAAGIGEVEYT